MNRISMVRRLLAFLSLVFALSVMFAPAVYAASTDVIRDYQIKVDVNDDGTLNMYYDISWEVLDSDKLGPLSWVSIGIPNSHVLDYEYNSGNILKIDIVNKGGDYAEVYFTRNYFEGETVDFSFMLHMDYMYSINETEEGYTTYHLTPGWFDDIPVDNLSIYWNSDKVDSYDKSCIQDDGYYLFQTSLGEGEMYSIAVTYPNDAYSFDEGKNVSSGGNFGWSAFDIIFAIASVFVMIIPLAFLFGVVLLFNLGFAKTSGFTLGSDKKITRTKIEYYESCPSCGADREEGKETCAYCGQNMIKSKEVITEENVSPSEKDILSFKENGTYRYSSNPNTYVRVNVVNIPAARRSSFGSSSGSSSRGGGHSCACASSCACACACACAGGGRAGCSTKDFYNTKLKLKYLKNTKA